jgi:hypothetical protein
MLSPLVTEKIALVMRPIAHGVSSGVKTARHNRFNLRAKRL